MKQKFKWLLALVAMVASVNLMAASKTSTLTFTAACNGSGTADDGVTWTVTSDAAESNYDATKGIHYGTSSKAISYLTLTSGSFDKKITKVVVNCSDANKTAMTSVTVGGKAFGTSQQETAYNNSAYTFEPTAGQGSAFSGVVVVSMSRTSAKKALYVKSIAVTFEDGDTPTEPVAPSITTQPEGASYEKDATATALTIAASGNPTPTYQWYSNTTESTSGASLISGATDDSYTPSTATIGTKYYYCVATNSKGSATSDIVAVTITAALPKITITKTSSGITTSYSSSTFTQNEVTFAYTDWMSSTDFIQAKASTSPSLKNTTAMPGKITKIQVVTGSGKTARAVTVKAGTTNEIDKMVSITSPTTSMDMVFDFGETNYTYFCLSTPGNACYFDKIVISYEELAPTNEAVTFAAPEGGSLVIKNGGTPITSGTTIQDETVLDVEFGMTPAEAYKDVAIKVTNTTTSADVTSTVYNSETQKITMPRYPITVAVTFTKLYKIEAATVTGGTLSWEDANKAKPTYVEAGTYIQALQEEATHYEFKSFDIYKTGETTTKVEDADGLFEMPAYDVTISGTFEEMQCTALPSAPVLGTPSISYAEGVTLNWTKLDAASGYIVNVWKGTDKIVVDEMITDVNTLSYKITAELGINTEYSYSIAGIGDDETYCMIGNPANESTFKTADYPAATLTLSENGTPREVTGLKVNTPFYLPNCSVECNKIFVGWSISDTDHSNLMAAGSSYTMTETTGTLYAWFATETPGTTTWNKVPTNYTDWVGNEFMIVYESSSTNGYVMKQADAISNYVEATIASDVIASKPNDAMSVIIEKFGTTDNYQIKVAGANPASYLKGASGNGLSFDASAQQTTISYDNTNGWLISNNSSWLRYNTTSGQTRFRFYKSSSYANYGTVQFYKKTAGASSYSDYSLICSAKANAPEFSLAEGTHTTAQTLTITAEEGANIYYTLDGSEPDNTKTLYTGAIQLDTYGEVTVKAIAHVAEKDPSDVVTKEYMMNLPFASLADLVTASEANKIPNNNATVTVTLSNIEIASFNGTKGVNLNVICEEKNVQIYNSTAFNTDWKVGGTLSHTGLTCTWQRYENKGTYQCWELMPANWDGFTYNDPAHITSIAISGEPTNKDYSDGQQLNPAGLVVTGTYSDSPEHTEVITEGLTWTLPTLEEGATTAQVSVKYTEPVLSNELTSDPYQVTINAVTPAKTLQSIYVADDSKHKTEFFVGRPFSAEGLKVMAKYNIGEDQAIIPTSVTPPAMTSAGTKQVTVSYTEGGVTAEPVTYDITLTYMNLNDLVAATDINDHDHVYVKFENVMITNVVSKGIYLEVQKDDKDIEIYCQSTNHSGDWEQYGTVSATLDNVEWTYYTNGSVWELMISNWSAFTYTAPNIPVTSMEISPAEVSVGEAKTTTLSIVYTPNNATNIGVTWAVTEGSEYASVDAETGVVTGYAVGEATITATLTADPSITATRTVTVTETPKCLVSYYVKGEVASTQNIAREEEGTLTYEPELVVAGYTFAGWAEAAIAEEAATATLISTYTPAADEATKSVYAIYKRVDDSSPTYQKYAKVTSALTNWAGDYLIAYSDAIFANGKEGGTDGIGKQNNTVDPEGALSGNVVTKEWGDQYKVILEEISAGSNTYVLKTQDGKYNYQTSNANGLTASSTKATAAAYPITVTFTSANDVKLGLGGGATGAVFRYNDQGFFRYYKDGGQKAVYLYKYDAGVAMYTSNPTAKVKVTFNLDGGVGGCGTITINEGEDAVLCEDAPTKDLNKFDAWSDGANKYAPGATIENVTEDIELTALWIAKKQYTISFNKGGAAGTTPASIKDYEYNVVTLPAQGDLSNPGYIFGGWNDGETTYAGGATFTMPEKNVSMIAVWVAKTNDKWYLVTSADQLAAGKQYAIVSNEKEAAMGAMVSGKTYMANVSASFNADKSMMIAIDPSAVILTLGGNATDGWTLSNNSQYLGSGTVKEMAWSTEVGDDYKWEITIADGEGDYEAEIENEVGYLCYNAGSPRFTTYSSVQSKVQLYVLVPAKAIDEEVDASTLDDHADVTVNEGGHLLVTEGNIELGDIYVMDGGKVTIEGTATLTVNNFVIKSTMGGGKSGQVIGVTSTNLTITGDAYFDVTLGKNGDPNQWHAFAVPFNVDAINGIYDLDDNKLTNEVNYAIMDYHGDVRATGAYGWKKFRGIMNPGTFYLMTVDGERTTYRMKMNGGFSYVENSISVTYYTGAGDATNAGWNGIANNQLNYSSVAANVQVLNPTSYTFETMAASSTNFTVGTPFFYQASADGSVVMNAANGSNPNYAPHITAEAKNIAVTLGNDNYTDRLYISATDEATNEYQIGRDLVKMTMTNAPAVPQIFAEAYGTKLCMVDAPMMYDEAVYALNLYAPANGEYTMGAAHVEGYEVFLVQNGTVIWNLSMSETSIALNKGNNTGYGLILKANGASAPTNMENMKDQKAAQKFIFNSNIYIRHNNQTFDVQGQLVK